MHKMMVPLTKRYAQFNGRASRSEFWWFQLFILIVSIPLYLLSFYAGHSGSQGLALVATGLSVVMWLVFVPFVSLVLLVFLLLPGTPGDNRFGAPVPHV
jgi:uncharacterized membrane protein YhaH (DUF805 family)